MSHSLGCLTLVVLLLIGLPAMLPADEPSQADVPQAEVQSADVPSVVGQVRQFIQPQVEAQLGEAAAAVTKELGLARQYPARFPLPVRIQAMADPWAALISLEQDSRKLVQAAKRDKNRIATLLDHMARMLGKPPVTESIQDKKLTPPESFASLDALFDYVRTVLDHSRTLHDDAVANIPADQRRHMVRWPETMVQTFGPQLPYNEQTEAVLRSDMAFCLTVDQRIDLAKMVQAAQTLSQIGENDCVRVVARRLRDERAGDSTLEGVQGALLAYRTTRHGLVILGGPGDNTYELKQPVALIVDVGGNDTYRGRVAASTDADHPLGMVIDLSGDDRYESEPLGLATGRLGVGILVDVAGDDHYQLARGSGGAGFAGIGVLCDQAGDDIYEGNRFTQGAAIGGIGLLLDWAGDDRHTSHGYAIGLGGPLGAGAVIDLAGDDAYQSGRKYPSGYNRLDAPDAGPDDPKYQWDAFGIGQGLGRRIFDRDPAKSAFGLAGGLGMVIDHAGNDQYDSSNFSQACGYYFGVGLKLDVAGDDRHMAARYGLAAGAHAGMGLLIDDSGRDIYGSTGPTYNGGCAWDRSVFMFIDAGEQADQYKLDRTSGPGRADIGSWAVFADLGGDDLYAGKTPGGRTSRASLAVFFDAAGADDYQHIRRPGEVLPADGRLHADDKGSLFWDRLAPVEPPVPGPPKRG